MNRQVLLPDWLLHCKNPQYTFQVFFALKTVQGGCAENPTTAVVLLLSNSCADALPMAPTACYASSALQSLRHGFAVTPPFTQGRL